MDFVRSYLCKSELLTSWTLFSHFLAGLLCVHSKPARKWGKRSSTCQNFICTEITSYKIHTLKKCQNSKYFFFRKSFSIWKYWFLIGRQSILIELPKFQGKDFFNLDTFLIVFYPTVQWLECSVSLLSFSAKRYDLS